MAESTQQDPLPSSTRDGTATARTIAPRGTSRAEERAALRVPVVRVLRRRIRAPRLLAMYDDHLLFGVCRRDYAISEPMLLADGEAELATQLRTVRRIQLGDVSAVRTYRGSSIHDITLGVHSGRRLHFFLPTGQAGHVERLLRATLPGQVPFSRLAARRMTAVLVVLLGATIGLGALDLLSLDRRGLAGIVAALGVAVFLAGLWLVFTRGAAEQPAVDRAAAPVAGRPARQPVTVAKLPLRSKPLGWALKLLGVAYWFILVSPLTDPLLRWLEATMGGAQPASYVWPVLWAPAPLLIFAGYRLCQRRYTPRQTGDPRGPILFLRPFQDDGRTSLQPCGATARATGIRARSAYAPSGRTEAGELLLSAHPMRMLRMLGDYGAGSSEESIARHFERHGPVIAIGKPGERLASPGAARMYLTDDSWQDTITSEMERAQAVVMQPAPSEGVRWELSHIRTSVAPRRVLLCLVSYWNDPEAYEELSSVVADTLGVDLPRRVPYARRPAFVYFDDAWAPRVQELSYTHPMLWPITADAADLEYTLSGFVDNMRDGADPSVRPPRRTGGPAHGAASLAAMALATIVVLVVNGLLATAGRLTNAMAGRGTPSSVVSRAALAVERSPRLTLRGRAVAYHMEVPAAMSALEATNPSIEHWRRSPDSHFEIQVVAAAGGEDLSNLAQARLTANSIDSAVATLDSAGPVVQDGVTWTAVQITVTTRTGVKVSEIARGTSGARGTVLIIAHIIQSPESEAAYRRVADEALRSFRFED